MECVHTSFPPQSPSALQGISAWCPIFPGEVASGAGVCDTAAACLTETAYSVLVWRPGFPGSLGLPWAGADRDPWEVFMYQESFPLRGEGL